MNMRRLLIFLLWLPDLAFAQEAYFGTRAASIHLSEEANPADMDRLTIHSGDVITPENIRASIQALFDTGRYRGVEVEAVASANGTDLTFNLSPHHFFGTFTLKPENLLERPLSTLLRLPVGQRFSESKVEEIVELTRQLLQDAGYFNAGLTIVTGPDNPQHIRNIELHADVQPRAKITEVDIQGGGVFTFNELRHTLGVSAGDVYNRAQIDKGLAEIKKKFLARNFLNTQAEATQEYSAPTNTVRLTVMISPGQQTAIETGKVITDEEARTLVPIFEEGAFDDDLLREGQAHIVEHLQQKGYFEASVEEPEIVPAAADSPTRVVFSINKGEKHSVKSVEFRGNTVFTSEQLQERIKIHPAGLFNHGLFSDELAKADVAAIQKMYRLAGYEAAFVEIHNEDSPSHAVSVTFDINENDRYRIQRLTFTGNESIPETDLRAKINLKEGDYYSQAEAENARTALTGLYYESGYPDARVEYTADRDADGGRLLTYRISEGRRYRIGEILVAGNTRTNEKFIRRTSGLHEYETWYDPEKILTAQQKLYATGLFSHVDIVPLDRDTGELRTVLIQIEEAKQITITPGVGVKEYVGPRVTLDIVHSNVFGGNRALGFRIRYGVREQQFQTTYHEPRLFNHDTLDGYGVLTFEHQNLPQFETSDVELALQVRKRISATRSLLTTASYQTVNLKDVKVNPIVRLFPDAEGVIQIARLGASFVSDTRDDVLDPKRGVYSTNTFQIASRVWGSEVNFVSLYSQTTYQRRTGRTATLAFSSRIGWKVPYGVTPELPITERYFAGGSTTLRGFGLDEAGPPGGGQLSTIGNAEYRVPFKSFGPNYVLGGALFYDTGTIFQRPNQFSFRDFTHSAGFGLRFKTPLGPIRFDVGFNLFPKTRIDQNGVPVREDRTHYFFTLGHPF